MAKFLVVIPDPIAPPGLLGQALIELGHSYDAVMPGEGYASGGNGAYAGLPRDPGAYDGLVVMGGRMNANQTDRYPFLDEIVTTIRAFDAAERPVMGVCLGAQLIARAYGGEVYRMAQPETGYVDMTATAAAAEDPVFSAMGDHMQLFHTHYDAVRGVQGATSLVTGGACPAQAFRVGRSVYGVQFHPEVTIDIVREWIRILGDGFRRDAPDLAPNLDRQFTRYFAGSSALCRLLVERWSSLCNHNSELAGAIAAKSNPGPLKSSKA